MTENQKDFKSGIAVQDNRHSALEPVVQDQTPNAAIMLALQRGTDPAIIEKLMELAERQEANVARKAYVKAMAAFKSTHPKIYKKKKAGFDHKSGGGRTEYSFAPLPDICEAIDPALSEQGLSYDWVHDQNEKEIIVTCVMTHHLGHSKQSTLRAPRDDSGKKNFIQSMGSTISYLERYTLLGVAGLATHEMDDDGQAAGAQDEFITEDQAKDITERLKAIYGNDTSMFITWLTSATGAETIDSIPAKDIKLVERTIADLEKKAKKAKKQREPGEEG